MIASGDLAARRKEEDAVERVLPILRQDGLLQEEGGRIAATPAAVRFSEFCELIL